MDIGRERPPPTGPWGEEGGMAEGVAHAASSTICDADTGTDQDAGGIERRLATSREVLHG
jgi:hypothetical protein